MQRRSFLLLPLCRAFWHLAFLMQACPPATRSVPRIWRFTLGTPEGITPVSTASMRLPRTPSPAGRVAACPVSPEGSASHRGYQVRLPLEAGEIVYGLGLQLSRSCSEV